MNCVGDGTVKTLRESFMSSSHRLISSAEWNPRESLRNMVRSTSTLSEILIAIYKDVMLAVVLCVGDFHVRG